MDSLHAFSVHLDCQSSIVNNTLWTTPTEREEEVQLMLQMRV